LSGALSGATAALDAFLASLLLDLGRHLKVARGDQSLTTAALDCHATAGSRVANNTKGLVLLLVLLHGDELVAQLDEDLFELLVLVPLLLILLLQKLLTLHALLEFALCNLVVHLQDRSFVNGVLVHL